MNYKFYSFPEIEQFRNVIVSVKYNTQFTGKDSTGEPIFDESIQLPILKFKGTVKMHGTNSCAVRVYNSETNQYEYYAESRTSVITPTKDNMGFAAFVHTRSLDKVFALIPTNYSRFKDHTSSEDGITAVIDATTQSPVKIWAEWIGKGIQKGVAVSKMDKCMVIFAAKIGDTWLNEEELKVIKLPEEKIYNILDYKRYEIEIDFNNPKEAADKMMLLVDEVEKECPVGKEFGIQGTGEGIVWKCISEGWEGSRYWFKTKGEEHKASKTKEKIPVDTERVNSINELVNNFVTETRLLQGIENIKQQGLEVSRKNLGSYLKWVYDDIIKEELDTIMANGFEPKEVSGSISNKARLWFFDYENKLIGL